MNVSPQEAPVYGGGAIIVNVEEWQYSGSEDFYLLFCGSEVRHTTVTKSALQGGYLQLQGCIPSHNKAEAVKLSVISVRDGEIKCINCSTTFHYVLDSAYQMAGFLSASIDNPSHLKDLEIVCRYKFQFSPDVQANFDERLTAAFKALSLPPCWNIMGSGHNGTQTSEKLLHFSARLGLTQLSAYFLTLPGSLAVLSTVNQEGLLPEDLALQSSCYELAQLFQYCRIQGPTCPTRKASALVSREVSSQLVVSTNINWSSRGIDYDISELKKHLSYLKSNANLAVDFEMKELRFVKTGGSEELLPTVGVAGTENFNNFESYTCPGSPTRGNVRVLEENLRRLRGIHEGIQKLRANNTKQIVQHNSSSDLLRLSNSCPTLFLASPIPDQDVVLRNRRMLNMRTLLDRRLSSPTTHSLDSNLFDSINVKIRINDITPSVSQECLQQHQQPVSPLREDGQFRYERYLKNGSSLCSEPTNIGGTASRRLAKKSGKKGPVRRQSWSSLGANLSPENESDKYIPIRRWSLSSLDSDAEEAFSDPSECFLGLPQVRSPSSPSEPTSGSHSNNQSPSNLADSCREKTYSLLTGNGSQSPLSKSAKQSTSVPSMRDITADIKENVEPLKLHGGLSATTKNFLNTFRNTPLQKSLSTPAIAVEDDDSKTKLEALNRQSLSVIHPVRLEGDHLPNEAEDEGKISIFQPLSLAGVLRESQHAVPTADSDEEKPFAKRKKRSSIFFKKKPDKHKAKEGKKTPHQFISCLGSSLNCDVCRKPFVKKQALKCENCLVIVHDSSCKDQVVDCNKFKLQTAQAKPSYLPVNKDLFAFPASLNGSTRRLPYYPNRYLHLVRPLSQSMVHLASVQNKAQSSQSRDRFSLTAFHGHSGIPSLSEAATRSSFISLGKMISEERDHDALSELHSNIIDTNSASMESLDEGTTEISDLEDNQLLRLTDEEPETWHSTVDKKVLKKLKDKEIKRQEAIYELILTEKHHLLTLQIMQKVYIQGMIRELNMPQESVERLFPCLPELLELHKVFLCRLRERQSENSIVENIADILEEQFHDYRAEQMKIAYGQFCSQHIEALNLYKEWSKSDRKFQNFIKRCSSKRFCKTKGIPECLLLVTQRITKYILVIESLMKCTKDSKEEYQSLAKVLDNLKSIISQVEMCVAEKSKELRLLEIFNKIEPKATMFYRGKKFKKSDLIANNRKLIREGPLTWRSPRGKTVDVLAVMVSDYIFFLHENNQKYCFASLENKPGIVYLQKFAVRKKAGQDSRGMYLVSLNPNEPEMIELLCRTTKDQKSWSEVIREAIENCPDEDNASNETEEEKRLEAARMARVKELISLLHERDMTLAQLCEEKMRLMGDLLEVVGIDSEQYENVRYSHLVESEYSSEIRDSISSAVSHASRLANSLYASGTNLSRSVSSAGEHHSEAYISPILPKRAETFGGFDNPTKEPVVQAKVPALKKKLLHIKDHSEPVAIPKIKGDSYDFELGDSLEIALRGFDSRTRSFSRPASICSSPDKQHSRKNSAGLSPSSQSSLPAYREVTTELSRLSTSQLLVSQGKEQLMQIVELAHHLNTVMCTVSHLSSTVESLKVQFAQANDKILKLAKEKEVRERRLPYRPEHQLEELRNLQKQLNHDRAIWQQEKAVHEEELKNQREELERLQEQVKTEQLDVTHQRELLYRKLDALQKQGIILSPSHTVLNNCIARDNDGHNKDELRSASMDVPTSVSPEHAQQHRRTYSCDFYHEGQDQHGNASSASYSAPVVLRHDSKNRPPANSLTSSLSKIVPMHLSSSATNLQKRQSMSSHSVKQQLPLKLASTHAANGTPAGAVVQGPHQVLPLKLASLPSNIPSLETKAATPKRSHSAASSPSSTLVAPVHVRGGSSPALVSYPPSTTTMSMSPSPNKQENNVFHQLKMAADKKSRKGRDNNEEIFC